jgi:hypothetical protein
MSQKMQTLLDLIVNEEMDKANELFHEIVVEKSREIYENMIAEESDEEQEESVEEDTDDEQDESVEEGFGAMDDESSMEVGDDDEEHDPAGALVGDTEAPTAHDEFGSDDMGDDESDPATRGDVQDLEDALAELKAEFEALMGGSGGEEDKFGGEEDGEEDGEGNPFGDNDSEDDAEDDSDDEEDADESMGLREYRETVGNDWEKNSQKTAGPVGSGKGDLAGQATETNTKSIVSSGKGKPTTGATAGNILGNSGKTAEGTNTGTSPNADKGSRGLVGSTKGEFTKGVEKNIAGSSTAKMRSGSDLAKNSAGHGAERKGSGPAPVGAGTGDKAGQTSVGQVKSPLNGAPNRNA